MRRPGSVGSFATSSRWARGPSPCSTHCASATHPTCERDTSSMAWSEASAATATASACRPSAASSCSTLPTRTTHSSTSWRSACSRSAISRARPHPARATSRSCSGARPGRDGIGGASVLASATFNDQDASKRPSVQVGDPFAEKLLIEASLELIERGLVEGLQDLGAAGITCATSETADRAGTGIRVDLDAIPRREPGMAPFEVMISESQERMLAIVRPERYTVVSEVCERWGLPCAVIGRVTDDGDITVVEGGLDADGRPSDGARELARIPAAALTSDAIVHDRLSAPPERRRLAPAPGAPDRGQRPAAGARHGPRRRPPRPHRIAESRFPPRRLRAIRLDRRRLDGGRARPGRRGDPRDRDGKGARRRHRWQRGRERHRSLARRRDERGRGDAQRRDHRRATARRHELPQLRRPDEAGRLLAAVRGGPRPRRRLPCAPPAGHRWQRLAVQRVGPRPDRADAADRRGRAPRRRRGRAWAGLPGGRRRDRPDR